MKAAQRTCPEASTALPRTLGRYTLFERAGCGGMAETFLARAETTLGATRLAVVKQILPAYADDQHFREMLVHEAKLSARLSHKHVVQVFDLGGTGGGDDPLYIAMEYVEGLDLNALLRRCSESKTGMPVAHALGIVLDVLQGLDHAHRLGIVHRDVSPSNVLVSYEGEVKLCDFGIAHANDLVKGPEREVLKGKAGYMSPEQARGETVDERSDVFAAGILLWELVAGRRLYRRQGGVPLLEQAQKADVPPLPDRALAKQERLAEIVMRALAASPDARYPSAAAFARDLEAHLADVGLLASRLELGRWMTESFGTELVDRRRASERRLPRSVPVARPRVTTSDVVESAVIPKAARAPSAGERAALIELDITPEPSAPVRLAPTAPVEVRVRVIDDAVAVAPATPAARPAPIAGPIALALVALVAVFAVAWTAMR